MPDGRAMAWLGQVDAPSADVEGFAQRLTGGTWLFEG